MNTKKYAFFVEGYTEQAFLKKILNYVFGEMNINIDIKEIKGGSTIKISFTQIETSNTNNEANFYILIYNCGGDGSIRSYIEDRRETLVKAGFSKIIGIRDVYPSVSRDEIHTLKYGLNYKLSQKEIPILFILSIMEIEAWILAENNHYEVIDSNLTLEYIQNNFGFNPKNHNTELIDEPANMIKNIYKSVGKSYDKNKMDIDEVINSLDFCNLYYSVNNRISSLKELTDELEALLE